MAEEPELSRSGPEGPDVTGPPGRATAARAVLLLLLSGAAFVILAILPAPAMADPPPQVPEAPPSEEAAPPEEVAASLDLADAAGGNGLIDVVVGPVQDVVGAGAAVELDATLRPEGPNVRLRVRAAVLGGSTAVAPLDIAVEPPFESVAIPPGTPGLPGALTPLEPPLQVAPALQAQGPTPGVSRRLDPDGLLRGSDVGVTRPAAPGGATSSHLAPASPAGHTRHAGDGADRATRTPPFPPQHALLTPSIDDQPTGVPVAVVVFFALGLAWRLSPSRLALRPGAVRALVVPG